MPSSITIIDYGMGNLGSIRNMLKLIGVDAVISSDAAIIERSDKLILPGVGAFDKGMENLKSLGLIDVLSKKIILAKTPILGICLGMQLFTKTSEEGKLAGLGWIDARTVKFRFDRDAKNIKIPHMGWNEVMPAKESLLFKDARENLRFYFLHSYYVKLNNPADALTITNYGHEFVSAIENGNIIGVQFHPEKSHKFGVRFLENFVKFY